MQTGWEEGKCRHSAGLPYFHILPWACKFLWLYLISSMSLCVWVNGMLRELQMGTDPWLWAQFVEKDYLEILKRGMSSPWDLLSSRVQVRAVMAARTVGSSLKDFSSVVHHLPLGECHHKVYITCVAFTALVGDQYSVSRI